MEIKTSDIFPTIFNNDLKDMLNHNYTEYCEKGGRGSCKSSFLSIAIILLMLQNKNYNALVLRKVADTLSESVYEQIKWAIGILGLSDYFTFRKSPLQIIYNTTGQRIIFRGADKPMKIKSIKLNNGYFAITWFEELTEFSQEDVQTIKLSTMRGGNDFWIFYSFNPPSSIRNWCNVEFSREKQGRLVHTSDYRAVPKNWLGEAFFIEAEDLKKNNLRSYENIFLGLPTGTGLNVFENIEIRKITDTEIESFDYTDCGVDFGYYPDPFVFVAMSYNSKIQTLFIFAELKLYKHGNFEAFTKLSEYMQQIDLSIATDRITADSAEPKSIADFRQWGANMRGAIKGKGSLDAGFKWLQSLKKIVIDDTRCPESADEFTLYEYETDKKTGEILTGYPQGQPDHAMAAVRYALEHIWTKRGE